MKKILTAMTAMSLTLQANENLNQSLNSIDSSTNNSDRNLETFKNKLNNQEYTENFIESMENSNKSILGGSGSFFAFEKTVRLGLDNDDSGDVTEGDVLIYDLLTNNQGNINASGLFLEDVLDSNISLINGSVTTSQGQVIFGNVDGDENVAVDLGALDIQDSAMLSFAATVGSIQDGVIVDVFNQAQLTTDNIGSYNSDDPNIFHQIADPTIINAFGVAIDIYNESSVADFVEHYETPTRVLFRSEIDRVSGEVGGAGIDLEDCFQFTVEPHRVVNHIILEDYVPSGGNMSTDFHVYEGLPPVKFQSGNFFWSRVNETNIGIDLIGPRTMQAGIYSICILESTPDQEYSIVFQSEVEDNIFESGFD